MNPDRTVGAQTAVAVGSTVGTQTAVAADSGSGGPRGRQRRAGP